MGRLLDMSSVMQCPHGGTVTAITSNAKVKTGSGFLLRSSDTFVIAGCAFSLGPVYHPCVKVNWIQADLKSKAEGDFTLSDESIGFCAAADQAVQGTVLISSAQQKVTGH